MHAPVNTATSQHSEVIYIIHGTNVHTWWLRLLYGPCEWWKPESSFAEAIQTGFESNCQLRTHLWSGKNSHRDRIAAAEQLAERIKQECGRNENIHLVGHSHGGNVALLTANFLDEHRIHTIVLLANPNMALLSKKERQCDTEFELGAGHFGGCGGTFCHWLYWGQAPQKVRTAIWNLYSPQDTVQSPLARLFSGVTLPPARANGASLSVFRLHESSNLKRMHNVHNKGILWQKSSIANFLTYPADRGLSGHSAMHSGQMGIVVGKLVKGVDFDTAMQAADLHAKSENEIRDAGCYSAEKFIAKCFRPGAYDLGNGGDVGVLLIHGFTASATETRPLAEYIVRSRPDWHCKGILLPGHGDRVEALERSSREEWLRASLEAYRELAKTCRHVFLAGVSMGAVLCCHVALREKSDGNLKIRGLILMAPAFGLTRWKTVALRLVRPALRFIGKGDETANYFVEKKLFSYTRIPLSKVGEMVRLGQEAFRSLDKLRPIPVLMFAGVKDETVSVARIREAHNANKWIRYRELQESEHILTVEPNHPEVFRESLSFMEELADNKPTGNIRKGP